MQRKIQFTATLVVALMACMPSAALAEFTSKSSQGKASMIDLQIKAGGAAINCLADETGSPPGWMIEKENKPSTKGASLQLKIKSLGACLAEAKGIKEAKVSSGECKIETKESGEEEKVPLAIISACGVKIETGKEICEVKLEPSENKELKEMTMVHSGIKNENMILNFAETNLATAVTGTGCAGDGISSSKTGELEGAAELLGLASAQVDPLFSIGRNGPAIMANGDSRTITVLYNGTVLATPNGALMGVERPFFPKPNNYFKDPASKTLLECNGMMFSSTETCVMKLDVVRNRNNLGAVYFKFFITWMGTMGAAFVLTG